MNYEVIGKVQDRAAESGYRVQFGAEGITLIGHGDEVTHPDADHALAWMEVQRLERDRLKRRRRVREWVDAVVYGKLQTVAVDYIRVLQSISGTDDGEIVGAISLAAWRHMVSSAYRREAVHTYDGRVRGGPILPAPVDTLIESLLDAEFGPTAPAESSPLGRILSSRGAK